MRGEQQDLRPLHPSLPRQPGDAVHVQAHGLQKQQRKEVPGLITHNRLAEAAPSGGRLHGEGQRPGAHIGVPVRVVRVGVVPVVLVHPPAVAQPDQGIGVYHADHRVGPGTGPDLAVRRIVPDEPHLREHDGQVGRHRQLPPGVAQQGEGDHADDQSQGRRGDFHRVISGPSLQQAGRLDLAEKSGELTSARRFSAHDSLIIGHLSSITDTEPLASARGSEAGRVWTRSSGGPVADHLYRTVCTGSRHRPTALDAPPPPTGRPAHRCGHSGAGYRQERLTGVGPSGHGEEQQKIYNAAPGRPKQPSHKINHLFRRPAGRPSIG